MKEIKQFQCEKCGMVYETEEECHKCESVHIAVDSIVSQDYYDTTVPNYAKYPYAIKVRMADGEIRTYYKDGTF